MEVAELRIVRYDKGLGVNDHELALVSPEPDGGVCIIYADEVIKVPAYKANVEQWTLPLTKFTTSELVKVVVQRDLDALRAKAGDEWPAVRAARPPSSHTPRL